MNLIPCTISCSKYHKAGTREFRPEQCDIVQEMSEEGKEQTKIFVARCVEGGTRLTLSGDLWISDGMTLFAIFGHCINEAFELGSCLPGLVSCATEHHTGDYIKEKTEKVLLTLVIVKVGDDDGLFKKVADNGANMVKGWNSLGCLDHTIERT